MFWKRFFFFNLALLTLIIIIEFVSFGIEAVPSSEEVWTFANLSFYISIGLGLLALYGLAFHKYYLFKELWFVFFIYSVGYEFIYLSYVSYIETTSKFAELDLASYGILSFYLVFMCVYLLGIYKYLCQIPSIRSKYLVRQ